MVTQRAFIRFMFTVAPVLAVVNALSGAYLLGIYCLMLAGQIPSYLDKLPALYLHLKAKPISLC